MTKELRDMLEQIEGKLDTVDSKVDELDKKLEVAADAVGRHDRTLYGNGQPGLAERFNAVETMQRSCPALQASILGNNPGTAADRKSNVIQTAMLIIATLSGIGSLIVTLFFQ